MKIEIHIDADNAAFEDNPGEISELLHKAAGVLEVGGLTPGLKSNLLDSNGNSVGHVRVTA